MGFSSQCRRYSSTEETAGNGEHGAMLCLGKGPLYQMQVLAVQCFQIGYGFQERKSGDT